ncbi:MAG TPA: class I SAM-dependent methyltransferase [Bacteroidota bacterium]
MVTSKFCDAADWFDPEIQDIILQQLRETPRFHRKQWEFASIFRALKHNGKLHSKSKGLSVGGGVERLLYSIAPHVGSLLVTDLYDEQTTWDCARTSDPEVFVKSQKPFPVDDQNISVKRMDMRSLDLENETFDFCYSTCAVEHIGHHDDFLRHFNEVARVLKQNGLYVMTTEVSYNNEVIHDDHNYVFTLEFMGKILDESDLEPIGMFDASISPHRINRPLPSNLGDLNSFHPATLAEDIIREGPHLQLLRGKHPFTCGLFLLQKRQGKKGLEVNRLPSTRTLMEKGVKEYAESLNKSVVTLNPYSMIAGEKSRFCADHREFFADQINQQADDTVFHTDYFWLGSARRHFEVELSLPKPHRGTELEIRIHRFRTLNSQEVECVEQILVPLSQDRLNVHLEVETNEDYSYAILGKQKGATVLYENISIESWTNSLSQQMRKSKRVASLPSESEVFVS